MKRLKKMVLMGFAVLSLSLSQVSAQNVFKTTPQSTIAYYEYVPNNYNSTSDKYPVVIFLHGLGERGPNTTNITTLRDNIYKVAKLGPPMYVKNGTDFPFILISPHLKSNYGGWPSSYVMEVINHVKTYMKIDERRIYITGLSLGGGGTWTMAQDFTKLFAAVAPVCGSNNSTSKAINIARESLPVWGFHGNRDYTVPLSRTVNMVNAINGCTPKPTPLAKVTIYSGISHNAWTYAYKTDNSMHTPNLYQWLLKFTNIANGGNKIPIAKAPADITKYLTSGNTLAVTGSATDADGSIAAYTWAKIGGPAVTMTGATTRYLKLSKLVRGTYEFRLTVKDNSGNTDSDYVRVIVK